MLTRSPAWSLPSVASPVPWGLVQQDSDLTRQTINPQLGPPDQGQQGSRACRCLEVVGWVTRRAQAGRSRSPTADATQARTGMTPPPLPRRSAEAKSPLGPPAARRRSKGAAWMAETGTSDVGTNTLYEDASMPVTSSSQ